MPVLKLKRVFPGDTGRASGTRRGRGLLSAVVQPNMALGSAAWLCLQFARLLVLRFPPPDIPPC
jgi:hypothetical protein